jgi:hypothetical protein
MQRVTVVTNVLWTFNEDFVICAHTDAIFAPSLLWESGTRCENLLPRSRTCLLVCMSECLGRLDSMVYSLMYIVSTLSLSHTVVDVVLKGWKCCLANRLNPEQDDCRKRKRTKASPLVQTIFMSPNGKVWLCLFSCIHTWFVFQVHSLTRCF